MRDRSNSFSNRLSSNRFFAYLLPFPTVAIATWVFLSLQRLADHLEGQPVTHHSRPYVSGYYLVIGLMTRIFGARSGFLTLALSTACAVAVLTQPQSLLPYHPGDWIVILLFITISCILIYGVEALRRVRALLAEAQSRARKEALSHLIERATRESLDADAIQLNVMTALGEMLNAQRCFFQMVDLVKDYAWIGKDWHSANLQSIAGEYKISDFDLCAGSLYPDGKTLVLEDLNTSGFSPMTISGFAALRLVSGVSVPIMNKGQVVGTLTVAVEYPRRWQADEVSLVETVAGQTRRAVELAHIRQREREIEDQRLDFYREVLLAVTGGRLILCDEEELTAMLSGLPRFECPLETPTDAAGLRNRLKDEIGGNTIPNLRVDDLLTAVTETASNAIKHGGGGVARVWIGSDSVKVFIQDHGPGIAPSDLARATLERGFSTGATLGMGFTMILATVDTVAMHTSPNGTSILLEVGNHPIRSIEERLLGHMELPKTRD